MSRVGKQPISIPNKVEVKISGSEIAIKGPLGELKFPIHQGLEIKQAEDKILVTRSNDLPTTRSLHGLTNRMIINMIAGVTTGFSKELELIGVGYKIAMKGKDLELYLGFSHPVLFKAPAGITIAVDKMNIKISGIDKQLVGETASKIRALKAPEPYKGKGIKYIDEHIRRKSGKMAAGSSGE